MTQRVSVIPSLTTTEQTVMHGQPLREMDKVIYTVCTLCRDHERSGFVDGIKTGIRLSDELPIA